MTISAEKAAETLVHYIKLALARELSPEAHDELQHAVDAFGAVDRELRELHDQHQ